MSTPIQEVIEHATRRIWQLDQLRVAAECRSAGARGGDFYVVARRDTGRVAVVIGDACGRGADGARLLPTLLPRVRELAHAGVRPGRMLAELNHTARNLLPLDRFVTLAALEIDTGTQQLVLSSAGHVPLLVRDARGPVALIGRASGPPLGIAPCTDYAEERAGFAPGDLVVLMTDGLLEAVESDLVNMTYLKTLVAACPEDVEAVHRTLLAALDRVQSRRLKDDVTLLCIESMGAPSARLPASTRSPSSSCAHLW